MDYFIRIPSQILSIPDLNAADKLVLSEVVNLSQLHGVCWASNQTISENLGTSPSTIKRCIKKLSDKGYVKSWLETENNNTTRKIKPSTHILNIYGGRVKMTQGLGQNDLGVGSNRPTIITSDNNNYNNKPRDLEMCRNFFVRSKSDIATSDEFFYYYDSIGWVVKDKPVRNWRSLAMSWIKKSKPQPKIKLLS